MYATGEVGKQMGYQLPLGNRTNNWLSIHQLGINWDGLSKVKEDIKDIEKKLNQVTEDRFKSTEWAVNENEETPILVGYDENSYKVIIQTLNNSGTDSGGFIYDLSEGAIIQCQKLFNWYTASTDNTTNPVNNDPRVAPPQVVNPGEGPLT